MSTNETSDLVASEFSVLIDQNLRDDGIVKPLDEWPDAHLMHLRDMVIKEMKARKESRPFWV